ncbi:CBS domain-containing protein [Ruegeria marina]|uniref:CBS domain-containing protein n=1 Tax=Ruegeria marina TaxID=639004 RepID=A0A1G6XLI8_9RHOB|nr:CBS domain-containing protein [Ruegeria marina]SDD78305.1 CBS domain-containing protein [Ruegeria marina]
MLVQAILKSKASNEVVTVPASATVSEAAAILAEKRIGTVVVSDDGKTALGIFSERDIVRELAASGSGCLTQNVSAYMTVNVVTCTVDVTAQSVLAQMTEGRFRHMPVVEGDKLIGIVTLGDVVKAQLSELAMEKDALEGMIMGH